MDNGTRFVMELLRSTGEPIGHAAVDPDWEPALEWTRLAGLRTRGVWAPEAAAERGIEPLWETTLGEPYMRGFRVHVGRTAESAWSADFPLTYFKAQARAARARLVEQGVLGDGDAFLYRLTAFRGTAAHEAPSARAFDTEDTPPPLALLDTPLDPWLAASLPQHDIDPTDVVAFLPQDVLDEATTLTLAAGDAETGGFLIGHLHRARDPQTSDAAHDIFVEVTALVPARHTVGARTKLTFTADTWTDARGAIALRGRGEQLLGWFHSHPQVAWCRAKGCSEDAQRSCPQAASFLSEDDCLLHRTMFPRAFTLALLITHTFAGCVPALFGWRQGQIATRGFHVLSATPAPVCA
jgi:proteasome lid subunit RPN8/RPN11